MYRTHSHSQVLLQVCGGEYPLFLYHCVVLQLHSGREACRHYSGWSTPPSESSAAVRHLCQPSTSLPRTEQPPSWRAPPTQHMDCLPSFLLAGGIQFMHSLTALMHFMSMILIADLTCTLTLSNRNLLLYLHSGNMLLSFLMCLFVFYMFLIDIFIAYFLLNKF